MKKSKRGFTIVETVIVIAVVAVLAAVLIPTFSTIVKSANISADTQLVKNMNTVLQAESTSQNPPRNTTELVDILKANGIGRIEPKTKNYTFYWLMKENVIILTDNGDRPLYPQDYIYETYDRDNWLDITLSGGDYSTEEPDSGELAAPGTVCSVTLTCNDPAGMAPLDESKLTAAAGSEYVAIIQPTESTKWITKVTVTMQGTGKKLTFRGEAGQAVEIRIPSVTGNIELDVVIKGFCTVTVRGNAAHVQNSGEIRMTVEKDAVFRLDRADITKNILLEGYEIASASVTMGGEAVENAFSRERNEILIEKVTGDTVIELTTQRIKLTVVLIINGEEVDRQIIDYGDTYTFKYQYSKTLIISSFGGGSTGFNMPEQVIDNTNHTITVTIREVKDNSTMKYNIVYANQ